MSVPFRIKTADRNPAESPRVHPFDESQEQLGPVDTGPPDKWKHIAANDDVPVALCGHVGRFNGQRRFEAKESEICPDCRWLSRITR